MAKERKEPRERETGGPDPKGERDPQPEATHGGDVEDFGEKEWGKRSGAEKIRDNKRAMDSQPTRRDEEDPTGENRQRLRTEGELGGKQDEQSSYQGGQGKKLPPPEGEDEPD